MFEWGSRLPVTGQGLLAVVNYLSQKQIPKLGFQWYESQKAVAE